jgi:hypothetical protein
VIRSEHDGQVAGLVEGVLAKTPDEALRSLGYDPPPVVGPTAAIMQKIALGHLSPQDTPELRRAAGLAQAQAGFDALHHVLGVPFEQLAPLRNMLGAIEALDRGIQDSMLKAAERAASRPIDPTRVWEARALLVGALEFRVKMGEPRPVAASAVVKDFGRKAFLPEGATLLQWRRDFAPPRRRVPRDGHHWEAYHTARTQLTFFTGLRDRAEREDRLKAGYKALIRSAQTRV